MNKKTRSLLVAASLTFLISSCDKDDQPAPETPAVTTGVYVLNEGNFGADNTTLSYYSFSTNTATTDYYANANGNSLGDTGNDILLYGSKMYIVMHGTSIVEVLSASTAKSVKKIIFKNVADRQPRYAVAYKNKVLVSSYDGTVAVIDTTSLNVEKWITVGTNPDGLAVSGDRLYVANSGGLNWPVYDSTVSVVDLNTMTEVQKIKVGVNPGSLVADNSGNIYVACAGNYDNIGPKLVKVSTSSNSVVRSADTTVGRLRFFDNSLYVTGGYYGVKNVRKLSLGDFTEASGNFVTDGTVIQTPYGVNIDETNGDVYITDAKNYSTSGEVFCFDKAGKLKFKFSTTPGVGPNTVAFIRQ